MTLCIAAPAKSVGSGTPCIVLCFDSKVASEVFGSETEHKFYVLSDGLMALVAGKPSRGRRLAISYQDLLRQTVPGSEAELVDILERGVEINKKRMAEFFIGSKFAISYDDLIQHGDQWLGKSIKQSCMKTIGGLKIGADMLVAGFVAGSPIIARVESESVHAETNFAMIGTGAYTAEPSLHARAHSTNTRLPEAVYNVYEAKRLGEASPYVGSETRMYIIHPPSGGNSKLRVEVLADSGKKFLERKFRRYGPKPLPSSAKSEPFADGSFINAIY